MPNKTLKATVKLNTTDAERRLTKLASKINNVQKAINQTSKNNNKLNTAINKAVTSTNKLNTATQKVANTTNKVANTARKVNNANIQATNSARKLSQAYGSAGIKAGGLVKNLKSLAATYLGVMGAKAVMTTSDQLTSAENRLNSLPGGNPELTNEAMNKIYAASMRSRSGYGDMLGNVSKSMTLASDSFQGNVDNAIRFQEIMSKAYTVGGASAAEQSSSMYQLIQALGSGVLQGDELRSLREGAPLAYKAIEEFAQKVFETEESLKDLASQGVITSDIVVGAIMDADFAGKLEEQFADTKTTFDQAGKMIASMATQAFSPVLTMLNDALNMAVESGALDTLGSIFVTVANIILWVGNLLGNFFTWLGENWDWISKVVLSLATIFGVILLGALLLNLATIGGLIKNYVLLGIEAMKSAVKTAISWMTVSLPLTIILALLAALIITIIWVSDSFADACGIIVGVIMTAVAFVWNLVVGIVNAIVQLFWTVLCEPIIGIIEFMLNACMGGFDSFGDGVANLIGQVISWFLSLGQVVTKIIDAIFGTDWTSGLESLKDKVTSWGKNENAITINREAPKVLDRWEYSDAYQTGYDWGYSGGSWVTNKLDSFLHKDDKLKEAEEYQKLGDSYDPSGMNDDILKGLEELNGTTGDIKDAMDLSNDDLEYMRKIADMEWRNEFTTAEIKVDMTNHNNVSSEQDLDGIVEYLSDVLRTEMTNVAYGTHY